MGNVIGKGIEGMQSAAAIRQASASTAATKSAGNASEAQARKSDADAQVSRHEAVVAEAAAFSAANRRAAEAKHPVGYGTADAIAERLQKIAPIVGAVGAGAILNKVMQRRQTGAYSDKQPQYLKTRPVAPGYPLDYNFMERKSND